MDRWKVLKTSSLMVLIISLVIPAYLTISPAAAQSVRQGAADNAVASFNLPRVRVQITKQQMAQALAAPMPALRVRDARGAPGRAPGLSQTLGVQPQNPDGGPSEYVPACRPGRSGLVDGHWEPGCAPGGGPPFGNFGPPGPLPYYKPSGSIELSTASCTYTFFDGDAFTGPANPGCPPYARYELKPSDLIELYPWRTNAKIFFKNVAYDPTGGWFVCSGKVISTADSGNGSLVLTAGHCVNSGGRQINADEFVEGTWSSHVMVCPAYKDGFTPWGATYPTFEGCWQGQQLFTLLGWFLKSNLRRDVGMIVTRFGPGSSEGTERIAHVTGAMGIGWNLNRIQAYNIQGYPQAAPFNGQRKIYCKSSRFRDDLRLDKFFPDLGPTTLSAGCDMTGGSSGGGWVIDYVMGTSIFNRNPFILFYIGPDVWRVGGIVNSVTSYRWIGPFEPDALQGPYFGTSVRNLWNQARVVPVLPP